MSDRLDQFLAIGLRRKEAGRVYTGSTGAEIMSDRVDQFLAKRLHATHPVMLEYMLMKQGIEELEATVERVRKLKKQWRQFTGVFISDQEIRKCVVDAVNELTEQLHKALEKDQ